MGSFTSACVYAQRDEEFTHASRDITSRHHTGMRYGHRVKKGVGLLLLLYQGHALFPRTSPITSPDNNGHMHSLMRELMQY